MNVFWYAVDKDGWGGLYDDKPERDGDVWEIESDHSVFMPRMARDCFPPLTWEDEPIQIEIRKV